jgi:hypothetical protein
MFVHVCGIAQIRRTARGDVASQFVLVCSASIIAIRQDDLLSSRFYKRLLCCFLGDFSSQYLKAVQITRP